MNAFELERASRGLPPLEVNAIQPVSFTLDLSLMGTAVVVSFVIAALVLWKLFPFLVRKGVV